MTAEPDRAVLGLDVGGTTTKALLVDVAGRVLVEDVRPTPAGPDPVGHLASELDRLRAVATGRGLTVVGAGVVTPGLIEESTGTVHYASNLGWRDLPLRSALQDRVAVPVTTGHDVRAAGLAERLLGAARGVDDVLLLTLGTGIAAALVSGGSEVTGGTGAAGEVGHAPVRPGGERCTCGQRGCLEVYASGAGVARRYAARTGVTRSAAEVVARLGADDDATAVWADATSALADALVTATLLLDPSVVVLGGGLARAGSALVDPVAEGLAAGLTWRAAPPVRLTPLGPAAGCLGAAAMAMAHAGLAGLLADWPAPQPRPSSSVVVTS
ncbi:ROK family protein [Modestobacter sp. Leaf380]|uniref:ROK family protein n=1 Tax=Modestobacter sp. Leaf380 TaxID=1736356 RepID=UPI0006F3B3B6|nr:ROK family protein [Modestobacter sp. Leaf380]KQS66283.1 ROK family transcriptional regulator [Modestobacter sp. Leaf380]